MEGSKGAKLPRFKSQLYNLLAMGSWACHLNLVTQFLHLQNGPNNGTNFTKLLQGLNVLIHVKHMVQ